MIPVYADLYVANPDALVAEGFESCYVGFTLGPRPCVAVYDHDACVHTLATMRHISAAEAAAYLTREVVLVYVGEHSPLFMCVKNIP